MKHPIAIVSMRELREKESSAQFLFDVYKTFIRAHPLRTSFGSNIVIMYESDYDKLVEKANASESPNILT